MGKYWIIGSAAALALLLVASVIVALSESEETFAAGTPEMAVQSFIKAFEGEDYVRETWLRADLSIIKAWRADPAGNLMFRKTARNFNPNMATAGKVTVVEVEEIVPEGAFDPACIHPPGIYVDRIVLATINEKRIEKLTTRAKEIAA